MTSFLMVVTRVDKEAGTVCLSSVFDWEPPVEMTWHYGYDGNPVTVEDKVGQTYRVTLAKLP